MNPPRNTDGGGHAGLSPAKARPNGGDTSTSPNPHEIVHLLHSKGRARARGLYFDAGISRDVRGMNSANRAL